MAPPPEPSEPQPGNQLLTPQSGARPTGASAGGCTVQGAMCRAGLHTTQVSSIGFAAFLFSGGEQNCSHELMTRGSGNSWCSFQLHLLSYSDD
ncbi:hypothetical protein Celaphus_00000603 [Cervus elaphus hippelaphus]|uniref:Uncharacterized protein n=1 Tax=Cervus elaphus hippelaphus TaxID=46360 RepID=A0A212D7D4_CEREH|nr:hypothetical protein Celaphus_00000603 [Cervus elaphus hippelaphus]